VAAIEAGGDMPALVTKLSELQKRQRTLRAEAASLHPVPRVPAPVIENRLAEWRRLLRASTTRARTVLQRLLRFRLTFTPRADGTGYDFSGPLASTSSSAGLWHLGPRGCRSGDTSGTGHIGPEDTFDGDYGRLLDAAFARKGSCARRESNPRPTGSKPVALSI
jgi:hypothetical protein